MDHCRVRTLSQSRNLHRLAVGGLAVLLLAPSGADAAHPLVTDDTGTQGQRKFQMELNGEYGSHGQRVNGVEMQERAAQVGATFTGGLLETLDLVVGAPWSWSRVSAGGSVTESSSVSDATVELKWRFFEREGFSLAVKPGVTFGGGSYAFGVTLIATQALGPVALHANAAYTRNEFNSREDRAANRADILHASLAAGVEVRKGLQLLANVGLESNGDVASNTWPAFALGGIIYSVTEKFDLDVGVKAGLTEPERDVTVLAGLAWRF